ncbi:MAG: DUF748 domain-containing protein, partial [Gammaproteobacteria bacterium]
RWNWPRPPGAVASTRAGAAARRQHPFKVGRLHTTGTSRIRIVDHGVQPRFRTELTQVRAKLERYDGSGTKGSASFELEGRLSDYGSLQFAGLVTPRPTDHNVVAKGTIRGMTLANLDAYARTYLGTQVRAGRGDATISVSLSDGIVNGQADLILTGLDLKSAGPAPSEIGQPPGSSIATSLALLEDKDGVVRLKVPFRGPLKDPQLRLNRLFARALVKTVRTAIGVTFKPVDFLLGLTQLLSGATPSEFAAVRFEPGDSGLSAKAQSELDTVGRELGRHPRVKLRVCGIATMRDDAWLKARRSSGGGDADALAWSDMLALAGARSDNVLRFLSERHGLTEARLPSCPPTFEPGELALPRVMLEIRATPPRPVQRPERESQG